MKGGVLYTKGLFFLVVIISPNYLEKVARSIETDLIRETVTTIHLPWFHLPQINKQGHSWGSKDYLT